LIFQKKKIYNTEVSSNLFDNKNLKKNRNCFLISLILLKTVNEKDHHFQDLAATLKKIKREVARDLVR
jgi:hypothetical protein